MLSVGSLPRASGPGSNQPTTLSCSCGTRVAQLPPRTNVVKKSEPGAEPQVFECPTCLNKIRVHLKTIKAPE